MISNQKGFSHLIILLILVIGIAVGIYFISNPTLFKPQAVGGPSIVIDGGASSTNSRNVGLTLRYDSLNSLQTFSDSSPGSGLVAYWKMDETNGTDAVDSKNGFNLTEINTMSSFGKLNHARKFNAGNSYLIAEDKPEFATPYVTVAGWVKPEGFGSGNFASIFSRGNNADDSGITLGYAGYDDLGQGQLECKVNAQKADGSAIKILNITRGDDKLKAGVWSHVACTYDGQLVSIYINGSLRTTAPGPGVMVNGSPSYIVVGKNINSEGGINAEVDEVSYWNRALTASEIANLYNNPENSLISAVNTRSNSQNYVSYRISNDTAGFLYLAPEQPLDQAVKTINWTLTQGNGIKTVYAQFKINGNWGTPVFANINLNAQVADGSKITRIMPLGDSMTYGSGSASSGGGGYRSFLWRRLTDNGYKVDFVGSMSAGNFPDPQNEGHGGFAIWNTTNPQDEQQLYTHIDEWLNTYNPDVILLLAGTNDMVKNIDPSNSSKRLNALIDKIFQVKPNVYILVASIPKTNDPKFSELIPNYVQSVTDTINARHFQGQNISFVDIYNILDPGSDFDPDGVHPNSSGYKKIADQWFNIIQTLNSVVAPSR